MHVICSSIVVSICFYVCPHFRKVGSVYYVHHHIFSLIRRICVEYPSHILSKCDPSARIFTASHDVMIYTHHDVWDLHSFAVEKKGRYWRLHSEEEERDRRTGEAPRPYLSTRPCLGTCQVLQGEQSFEKQGCLVLKFFLVEKKKA